MNCASDEMCGGAAAVHPDDARRAQPRILLVDDDASLRRLMRDALALEGYDVTAAAEPLEALALAAQGPAYDLLVSDVEMPFLSGPELAESLLALTPQLELIFVSGGAGPLRLPPNAVFLQKPFALEELLLAVREALVP